MGPGRCNGGGTFDPGAPAGTACGAWWVSEARGVLHKAVAHPWSKDIRAERHFSPVPHWIPL